MRVFVGCSSSENIPDKYFLDCKKFLLELFEYDLDLVFGACGKGLMGLAYEITKENGGNVLGIYPDVYKEEVNSLDCEKIMTDTVPDRTNMVISESDALIFLPGGFGTIYEFLTAIECRRAYEFAKPIILYNVNGYFDKLFEFFETLYDIYLLFV